MCFFRLPKPGIWTLSTVPDIIIILYSRLNLYILDKISKAANLEFSSKDRFLTSWTFLMCFFNLPTPGNSFLHFSQIKTWVSCFIFCSRFQGTANSEFSRKARFLPSWTFLMCFFRLPKPGNSFLHFSQMNTWVSCFMFCWRFQRPQTWSFLLKLGSLHHGLFLCAFLISQCQEIRFYTFTS